jgi:hypothetical protein
MPSRVLAEYKLRQIAVTVIPCLDGHFRIQQLGLWSQNGQRTGYTKVTVPGDLFFVTRAKAESYALAFAKDMIDRGVVA